MRLIRGHIVHASYRQAGVKAAFSPRRRFASSYQNQINLLCDSAQRDQTSPIRHQQHDSFSPGRARIVELGKLGCHRRVAPRQLLDRYILRHIVRKTQVPICAKQCVLGFLQVVDRFIDLIDCLFEAIGSFSFFISNMIDTISVPDSSRSRKM